MKNDLISRFDAINLIMTVFKKSEDTDIKFLCCTLVDTLSILPSYGQGTLPLKQGEFCHYCGAAKVDKK